MAEVLVPVLKLGDKFDDYAEFERTLANYEQQHYCKYVKADSRSVEKANELLKKSSQDYPKNEYHKQLKYSYIVFKCKHAGCHITKSQGLRPNQRTFKMDCPSKIVLSASGNRMSLVVSKMVKDHNHPLDEEAFHQYPESRRLDKSHEEVGKLLYKLFVPPKVFHETLQQISGKMLTNMDTDIL